MPWLKARGWYTVLDAVAPTPLCASAAAESHADTSAAREPSLEISPEQPAPDPSAYQSLVTSHTHTLSYPTEAEIGHTVFQAHPLNLQYLTELDTNASPTIRQLPDTVPKNIKSNSLTFLQGGPKKLDHFLKCITFLYKDIGRHSIYQNVQLFITSKTGILHAAMFKYSLHRVSKTILH